MSDTQTPDQPLPPTAGTLLVRAFAWTTVATTLVFLINNYLTFWRGWPGAVSLFSGSGDATLATLQMALYVLSAVVAVAYVFTRRDQPLRDDAAILDRVVAFFIRAAFWAVFLVGVADVVISFLRVEELLGNFFSKEVVAELSLSRFRGPYVHLPLIIAGILLACVTRTLGFTWLALLVVLAEFLIVISRFIFSYEQAFMGDLVRFWYAALFLFASAYTLLEEGHVRVDVLYASFSRKTKGFVNAVGSIVMGILFCWVILTMGMWTGSSIINAPLVSLEVSQSGFGMYTKYMMAGFLAVFAVSMMIQFCSYLMQSVADYRGDPGWREVQEDENYADIAESRAG